MRQRQRPATAGRADTSAAGSVQSFNGDADQKSEVKGGKIEAYTPPQHTLFDDSTAVPGKQMEELQ